MPADAGEQPAGGDAWLSGSGRVTETMWEAVTGMLGWVGGTDRPVTDRSAEAEVLARWRDFPGGSVLEGVRQRLIEVEIRQVASRSHLDPSTWARMIILQAVEREEAQTSPAGAREGSVLQ